MHSSVSIKNVQEITLSLTLSEADARAALDDPFGFGERVVEALRPHLAAPAQGRRYRKPKPHQNISQGKNGRGKQRARRAAPKGVQPPGLARSACPRCGRLVAARFMPLHLRKAHGAPSAETAVNTLPDTAPAAE